MHLPVMIHHFLQSHKQSNLKANADPRIAENLHTDKKEEDEEEGEGDDGEKEEVAIGKERMSRIQSMFSGEKKNMEEDGVLTSPSCTDFNELLDEGWILLFCKKNNPVSKTIIHLCLQIHCPLSQVWCQPTCTGSQAATCDGQARIAEVQDERPWTRLASTRSTSKRSPPSLRDLPTQKSRWSHLQRESQCGYAEPKTSSNTVRF